MRRPIASCLVLVGLAHTAGSVRAGALPDCDPEPSEQTAVASADLVVVAAARSPTRRSRRSDALRTDFVVTKTLRGSAPQ